MQDQVRVDAPPMEAGNLPERWTEWLADNLMRGVPRHEIASAMLRRGFSESFVATQIESVASSPTYRAGKKICESKRKLDSLFEALSTQYRQSRYAATFTKQENLSPSDFYDQYYFVNRPVVIRGLMADWEALRLWTPEYFTDTFGDCEVEVTSGRENDPRYEDNFGRHRTKILMRDYVHMIQEGGQTNDYYLVAKNGLLARDEFQVLYNHFACPDGYLEPSDVHVALWFGPHGTVTPLHHDGCNSLFGQIYGRKQIKLISPYDIEYVYNDRECFSAVNLESIDDDRFPLMRRVEIIDVVLEPGEFILLPVGWWHWVKSLDVSISLSFTNFCVEGHNVAWGHRRWPLQPEPSASS